MTRSDPDAALSKVPEAANKTSTLGADIPDPWHQDQVCKYHLHVIHIRVRQSWVRA